MVPLVRAVTEEARTEMTARKGGRLVRKRNLWNFGAYSASPIVQGKKRSLPEKGSDEEESDSEDADNEEEKAPTYEDPKVTPPKRIKTIAPATRKVRNLS